MQIFISFFTAIFVGCGVFPNNLEQCRGGPGLSSIGFNGLSLQQKNLSVTFDSGPAAITTALSDYLSVVGVPASFFFDGYRIPEYQSKLDRLKNAGHLVAQRGYSGRALTTSVDPALELRNTDYLISPFVTGNLFLFRAPNDKFNESLTQRLNQAGLNKYVGPIHWEIGENKPGFLHDQDCLSMGSEPSICAQYYLEEIRKSSRGIIRFHGLLAGTLTILQIVIPKLIDEGYRFVRLDQVPSIRVALEQAGGNPGVVSGEKACNEY